MIRRIFLAASLATGLTARAVAVGAINLVFDGDSISAGWGASAGHGLDARTAAALGEGVTLHNVAVGGRPVHECLRLYPALVAPLYQPNATRNIIAFHAGDNDIRGGRDADPTYQAFTSYVAAAHAQGWKVAVSTEMARPDFNAREADQLAAYNAMLRHNAAGADDVVDFDTDPRIADLSYRHDRTLFGGDGIHPADAGYAILAAMLVPAVRQLSDR